MAIDRSRPLLCFVHSASDLGSALGLIERGGAAWGAADLVQVRGKGLPAGDLEALVRGWLAAVAADATRIVVNDRLDVALATGAHGIHVGRADLPPEAIRARAPELLLGMSAHDRAELLEAQAAGADYAGLGAFYDSRTKPEAVVLDRSAAGLLEPSPGLRNPVLAIGGITAERIPDVLSVPVVTGIAVSEAIQGAIDPAEAVARLRSALDRAWADLRRGTRAALAVSLAWLAACGGGEPGAPEAAAPDAAPSAEVRLLIDPTRIRVQEVFRLPEEAAARANLRQPRDLALDDRGRLIVLDFEAPDHRQIVTFEPSGAYAIRFGEIDDRADRLGPADQFAVMPWKYVMLVDAADNALTSFLTLGTYVSTVTLTGVGMVVEPIPEYGHFYLKKWDPPRRRAYVVHMQLPIDSLSMVYQVTLPPGQSVRKDARDVSFLTASDGAGRLYVAFNDVYRIRVLDRQGATLRIVESARRAVRKSPPEIEAERARLLEHLRRTVGDVSDSLLQDAAQPDSLYPLVEELVVDPAGRLWVRTRRPEVTAGTVYDVFNDRGELVSWVSIPAVARRTAFGPDGRLFVIDERDPERPRIVGYEVGFGGAPEEGAISRSGPAAPGAAATGR